MNMASIANKLKILGVIFFVVAGLSSCTDTPKPQQVLMMDPSWDADGDGINDCEQDGTCDHTVDYTQPRIVRPSFNCQDDALVTVEKMICQSAELANWDNKLAKVFKQAKVVSKEPTPGPGFLQTEQRGWIKGRNECWKSGDVSQCVSERYIRRIAELQARYHLVSSKGPIRFQCADSPMDELVVSYFDTEPRTLISERGDTVSLMYQTISASGAKYQGRNESFWEHQGEVILTWGANNSELHCQQNIIDQEL
jgi:uncharacterized protein